MLVEKILVFYSSSLRYSEARLLASKLTQDASVIAPPELSMTTTVHEETVNEEPAPASSVLPDPHVTLRDVSVIEKAMEMNHELPNAELSMSLLPCIPTANPVDEEEPEAEEEEQQQNNKSIASTISDKTFVKTSSKPFSSDEDSDDDDDDDDEEDEDTIIEGSPIPDSTESARALLLTADRSIRRPPPSLPPVREEKSAPSARPSMERSHVKREKVSFREPLAVDANASTRTLLLNKTTFDAEKSDFVRPTIVEPSNTSQLPTIPSADA